MATDNVYNVYLADLPGKNMNIWYSPIREVLQSYFDRVVKEAPAFSGARVQWTKTVPPVKPWELLVYFLKYRSDSLIVSRFKQKENLDNTNGFTKPVPAGVKTTTSEVYVAGWENDSRSLANLAFHELMHNKLQLGDYALHNGIDGTGLAVETITPTSALSQRNVDIMAANLRDIVPQWTEGYTLFFDPMKFTNDG
jgi:hypothetical protein